MTTALAEQGAALVLHDRQPTNDADPRIARAGFAAVAARHRIGILVCSAGIQRTSPQADHTRASWDAVIAVNAVCPGWVRTDLVEPQIAALTAAHDGDADAGRCDSSAAQAAVAPLHRPRRCRCARVLAVLARCAQRHRDRDPARRRLGRGMRGTCGPGRRDRTMRRRAR